MCVEKIGEYTFETGIYRPPSEGGSFSLLLRITRNCPWNRCTFCFMYKTEKYSLRSVEELKQDVDSIAAICDNLITTSNRLGLNGQLTQPVVMEVINKEPLLGSSQGFMMILNWLNSGGKTAFLQDANTMNMRSENLIEILKYIRKSFPTLERVTSYARSKTVGKKEPEELKAICEAGLDRLHIGLESGDDEILKHVKKGVTAEEHIIAGKKAMAAGFQLSEYWMPGLGGKEKWEDHARNTAKVLNQINPNFIRSRPFFPMEGTPIADEYQRGELTLLTPREQLLELKLMMQELTFDSRVCFDHAGNHWRNRQGGSLFSLGYEGYKFPREKEDVLELIEEGLEVVGSE